ncbi:uncharacterized protein K489DRAFT_217721 [Dissoconium aciculare CBS 342.82]|uniref:Uncharacterized protein n=1 Tax=Dissoconium aciculare CBS 342.82 TaxID=1314786 RepID=A0A6J3M462_9PEZI|nr:uncharacterized protein K489DRAFT_217721 [Dissoconium aciculare CBS 342.82]KAF1822826.1 hypothetical protein K489DRAFT_217721 [Dissoconium aciculare CBS 342.82]
MVVAYSGGCQIRAPQGTNGKSRYPGFRRKDGDRQKGLAVRGRVEYHRPTPVALPREMTVKHYKREQSDGHKPAVSNEGGTKGEGQAGHGTHRQLSSSCTRSDRCLVTGKHGTDEWPQLSRVQYFL